MRRKVLVVGFFFLVKITQSQIIIDNTGNYGNPNWLIDNILLGGGITATNHSFQGEPSQIGWFDAINTNLGIDSGIVMACGDIYALDPITGSSFPLLPNTVTDPDLLAVANSVPGMIGQTFSVSSIGDVAILEFDFIPTSDSLEFRYAFGSQEYFGWENSSYNDVFGFFLSGPGITGPWSSPAGFPNGSINLAIVPGTNPPLPITISSVNSAGPMNPQYFVDNQSGLSIIADADGFTTVLTAQALVECGETYHIKLAIADGSDQSLNSYVWLEAGSFYSAPLEISDDLSIDSTIMNIPCNSSITLTAIGGAGSSYQWFDSTLTVFSTDSFVTVGEGVYIVSADISGCAVFSDTLRIIEGDSPILSLGSDLIISCGSDTLVDPVISGGTSPYTYLWNTGETDTMIMIGDGIYSLTVTDTYGCYGVDTIEIFYEPAPQIDFTFDGLVFDFIKDTDTIACNSNSYYGPVAILGGSSPFTYLWEDASLSLVSSEDSVSLSDGLYYLTVTDIYGCYGRDTLEIFYESPPQADLGLDYNIPCNTTTSISPNVVGGTQPYSYVWSNGSTESSINIGEGNHTVTVLDLYGCSDSDEIYITEDAPDTVTVSGGGSICYGDYLDVDFNFKGLFPWELIFTDGLISRSMSSINDTTYTYTTSEGGLYSVVEARNANGCVAISIGNTQIIVNPLPVPEISPSEVSIYQNEQAELSVGSYSYYEWSSDYAYYGDTLSSSIQVSDSGSYYIFVIDENGCTATDTAIVYLTPLTQIFIPSIFTPNGDNHNELFVIKGEYIKDFNIKIFNRWGEKLFESNEIGKYWDGTFENKKVQAGMYYYHIEILGEDGNNIKKTGTVQTQY